MKIPRKNINILEIGLKTITQQINNKTLIRTESFFYIDIKNKVLYSKIRKWKDEVVKW